MADNGGGGTAPPLSADSGIVFSEARASEPNPAAPRVRKRDIAAKLFRDLRSGISAASSPSPLARPVVVSAEPAFAFRREPSRWQCPRCATVNASDLESLCCACGLAVPSLLVDPRLVCLPPASRRGAKAPAGAATGAVVASTLLLGPFGLVAATAAASISVTNERFQDAVWSDEVQGRLRAQTTSEPWRDLRAVVRLGGGLCPEEMAFLAARDAHVAEHMQAFLGTQGAPLRVSLAAAGGGLRATLCHVAALQVAKESGLLDCVTYLAGLSGSTWSLGGWYASAVARMKDQGQTAAAAPFPPLPPPRFSLARDPRSVCFAALDQMETDLRSRMQHDLRCPPLEWVGDCRKEWVATRFAARKAQGLELTSTDLFGGTLAKYILSDCDGRGTTLSEQRALLASGAMPLPVYTCVRKDLEADGARGWMADNASACCVLCSKVWSRVSGRVSRHHCRACGRLVCGACSTRRVNIGSPRCEDDSRGASEAIGPSRSISGTACGKPVEKPVRVCDECFLYKRYETQSVKEAKNWWEWWEFTPFEVGPLSPSSSSRSPTAAVPSRLSQSQGRGPAGPASAVSLGPACPTWAFGRQFHAGVSLSVAPGGEAPLGLLLGVFGAAFNATFEHVCGELAPGLPSTMAAAMQALSVKYHGGHLTSPATFHDFNRVAPQARQAGAACSTCTFMNLPGHVGVCGMCGAEPEARPDKVAGGDSVQVKEETPPLVALTDAGLAFNFPLLPLLRPERAVDVHVVLDYSQYDPEFTHSSEWAKVVEYCQTNGVPFPTSFDQGALARTPFSVFQPGAAGEPTIIVLHLNVSSEEAAAGMFSPLANAKAGGYCDLGTLKYTEPQADELLAFGKARVRQFMPDLKAALRIAQDAKCGMPQRRNFAL